MTDDEVLELFCKCHQEFPFPLADDLYIYTIRDGLKKSKWKFKMAFAMKGGGLEGVSSATYLF